MKKSNNKIGLYSVSLAVCILSAIAVLFSSCRNDIVYSQFHSISYPDGTITSSENWHMDSIVRFDFPIPDTTLDYTMTIYLRHTEHYPYQNIWLFAGNSLHRDTINSFLADDRGRWYGNHQQGLIETSVFIGENRHFSRTDSNYVEIQHGMRDTLLHGVMDIGLEIRRNGKE